MTAAGDNTGNVWNVYLKLHYDFCNKYMETGIKITISVSIVLAVNAEPDDGTVQDG